MSDETERVEEPSLSVDSALDFLEDYYHVPVLAALAVFMLWVRTRPYENFVQGGEVYFSGNDPWYHYRQVVYTVQNWPATMPFDPWTNFSFGTSVGQFGTLFDQLIATAAIVVGLGDPSQTTVAKTVFLAPAVFGTLVLFPTYFIGKRLGGRLSGVFGAVVLALLPGLFLFRSFVGTADHNIAEPLFQATAVFATMVALTVADREKVVWEQFADRDVQGLRAPVGWSAIAGVATALYLWLWPPGVMLVGILGVFYVLKLTRDYLLGTSPDHAATVAAVSMAVTAALTLLPLGYAGFSPTRFSLLQPLAAAGVGAGAVFVAWLAREWDARDLERALYPVAVYGLILVGTAGVAVLLPDLFGLLRRNLVRFVGFDAGAAQRTIGEAQPFIQNNATLFQTVFPSYGFAFFTAVLGAIALAAGAGRRDERDGERLLVLVWFVFITAAAFTQIRFNYYLAVPVAVLNAYLLQWAFDLAGGLDALSDIRLEHGTAIFIAILVVVAPLAGGAQVRGASVNTAEQIGTSNIGPDRGQVAWSNTLDWVKENTPEEGTYGGANNSEELDYYGTYAGTGNFDYPAGAYGVLAWWDYGHWITVEGERIPNANPFQQGASSAANFLHAPNASAAQDVLDTMDEDDAKTRYVMVDWKLATPGSAKFNAPTVFYDGQLRPGNLQSYVYHLDQQGRAQRVTRTRTQRFYQSMVTRLYHFHGSAAEPQPVVTDWRTFQSGGQTYRLAPENGSVDKRFDTMAEARAYVANDSSSKIGGYGPNPTEYVEALEQFRLVGVSDQPASYGRILQGQLTPTDNWVKVFERVDGATVRGQGPANANVTASVEMEMTTIPESRQFQGNTFTYTQRVQTGPDGSFEMTVPYSTTGYDDWGTEEGYTNVSVRANGSYTLTATTDEGENGTVYTANATVTEAQVIGEDGDATTVTLEPSGDAETGDDSDGNQTDDNQTDGNQTNDTQAALDAAAASFPSSASPAQPSTGGGPGGATGALAGIVAVAGVAAPTNVRRP